MAKERPKKQTSKPNVKTNAESVAHDLIQYDSNELPGIKESLKGKRSMMDNLRSLLEEKAEIPANSDVYAGLKITNGRINYRSASEELSNRLKMTPQQYELFLNDFRKPGSRLKYGTKDSETQFYQEDFSFITPRSVVVED
ncbi:MAG: hypothetical protein AABX17_01065 [Nanoarchaeota archaeon]